MILTFLFHPYILKRQSLAEDTFNIQVEKKKVFTLAPQCNTTVLPLFWCDVCSLKTNLENPSAIKKERSFLGEKNSLGHNTQKKSNHELYESWLHLENCLYASKLLAQLWSKSSQKEWGWKIKSYVGDPWWIKSSFVPERRKQPPCVLASTTIMRWGVL